MHASLGRFYLREFGRIIENSGQDITCNEVIQEFIAFWLEGAGPQTTCVDDNNESVTEVRSISALNAQNRTVDDEPIIPSEFGINRNVLASHLRDLKDYPEHFFNDRRNSLDFWDSFNLFCHRLAKEVRSKPPSKAFYNFASTLLISHGIAYRFLVSKGLLVPDKMKTYMGIKQILQNPPERKNMKEKCPIALREIISSGLYVPKLRGTAAAARLIAYLYDFDVTSKGIENAIREEHDELASRERKKMDT